MVSYRLIGDYTHKMTDIKRRCEIHIIAPEGI